MTTYISYPDVPKIELGLFQYKMGGGGGRGRGGRLFRLLWVNILSANNGVFIVPVSSQIKNGPLAISRLNIPSSQYDLKS